jgi:hypothetical protein
MPKKRKRQKVIRPTPEQILKGIHAELRSIVRQRNNLIQPIKTFSLRPYTPKGKPCYYVDFDNNPRRDIRGLCAPLKTIRLPDEKIQDEVLQLAQSVWHIKDRLKQWVELKNLSLDIEKLAESSVPLQVCADLANRKKHGRFENRSGLYPWLDKVSFDTSKNGLVELFYDGSSKEKELLVTNPVPIAYTVDILVGDGKKSLGNAVDYIGQAFNFWLPIIRQIGIFTDDPEGKKLHILVYRLTNLFT